MTTAFSWIIDNGLNATTYLVLRLMSPSSAKAWAERLARFCRPICGVDEAYQMAKRLGGRGTCLSRSLTLLARCPGAQMVIGVNRPVLHPSSGAGSSRRSLAAHAWVEFRGVSLDIAGPSISGAGNPVWQELGRMGQGNMLNGSKSER